jgi:hypothetical protein
VRRFHRFVHSGIPPMPKVAADVRDDLGGKPVADVIVEIEAVQPLEQLGLQVTDPVGFAERGLPSQLCHRRLT